MVKVLKQRTKPEDQWSCSSPETICSEQVYGNNSFFFLKTEKYGYGSHQFEKSLVSVSYRNLGMEFSLN